MKRSSKRWRILTRYEVMELFVHFEFVFITFGYYAEQQRAGHVRGHENSIRERSSHSTGRGGPTAD